MKKKTKITKKKTRRKVTSKISSGLDVAPIRDHYRLLRPQMAFNSALEFDSWLLSSLNEQAEDGYFLADPTLLSYSAHGCLIFKRES